MRTMDPTLKAALLMNAAHAPLPAFRKLCENYAPEDLNREELWDALNLTPSVWKNLSRLLREGDWPEREEERAARFGARFLTVDDPDFPARLRDLSQPPRPQPPLSTNEKVVLALLQRQGGRTMDELLAESGLDLVTLQTCMMTLSASGLAVVSGPGRFSAGV